MQESERWGDMEGVRLCESAKCPPAPDGCMSLVRNISCRAGGKPCSECLESHQ